jgi:Flp pilus assembly protein TadG
MKILKDESGQTIVVAAVFMALIAIAFMAFAVDVGSLYRQKDMAQTAADAVAVAAAEEVSAGDSSNEQTVANAVAKLNGFDTTLAKNPAVVTLSTPATGNFTGSGDVQAVVSRPIPTFFMGAFQSGMATVPVSATAIAGTSQSQTCLCLEKTTGQDLYMSNGAKITASTCGIVDNSSSSNAIGIVGATLSATTLGTVSSNWDNATNINNGGSITASTTIVQGITSKCSPTMPTAPSYSSCIADPGGSGGTHTFGPASAGGVICYNGLTIGANAGVTTLNPGTYVISNGYLTFDAGSGGHSNLGGNGVFFYLTGTSSLTIQGSANVNLVAGGATESGGGTAPTVGIYNGILIYQAASDTAAITIDGGSTAFMNGAILAPGAAATLDNGTGTVIEGGIALSTLTIEGGATLTPTTDVNQGGLSTGAAKLVQ